MDGRRSGREQDRNQGDKEGGSDEAIHVEKYCVGAERQRLLKGCFVGFGQLPRQNEETLAGEGTMMSSNRSINTNRLINLQTSVHTANYYVVTVLRVHLCNTCMLRN